MEVREQDCQCSCQVDVYNLTEVELYKGYVNPLMADMMTEYQHEKWITATDSTDDAEPHFTWCVESSVEPVRATHGSTWWLVATNYSCAVHHPLNPTNAHARPTPNPRRNHLETREEQTAFNRWHMNFLCNVGYSGQATTLAAPNDPYFFVVHPIFDRMVG